MVTFTHQFSIVLLNLFTSVLLKKILFIYIYILFLFIYLYHLFFIYFCTFNNIMSFLYLSEASLNGVEVFNKYQKEYNK